MRTKRRLPQAQRGAMCENGSSGQLSDDGEQMMPDTYHPTPTIFSDISTGMSVNSYMTLHKQSLPNKRRNISAVVIAEQDDERTEHELDGATSSDSAHSDSSTGVPESLRTHIWQGLRPMHPLKMLQKMLTARGVPITFFPSVKHCRQVTPTQRQLEDYDLSLTTAVRSADLEQLRGLHAGGRSMMACNKYNESILHTACRRGTREMVAFMLENGANPSISDDFGRTPLHDACWRLDPHFDIVTMLLDNELSLLYMLDVRGASPLSYVRREHWLEWCAYLVHHRERYWPVSA
jgi:hypothetical protein